MVGVTWRWYAAAAAVGEGGGKLCSHRWLLVRNRPPPREATTPTGSAPLRGRTMAKRMPTVNSVKEQADAELYFEMEFPGKDPDTISFSSKSIESFSSETTNPDSR